MKKHPIDELFAQKLSQFEARPSDGLKSRFLAKFKEESPKEKEGNAPLLKYFAAAASVALLIGVAWVNWPVGLMRTETNTADNGDIKGPQKVVAPQAQLQNKNRQQANEKGGQEAALLAKDVKKPRKKQRLEEVSKAVFEEIPVAKLPLTGVLEMDERIPDKLTVALEQARAKSKLGLEAQRQPVNEGLFREGVGETTIIVSSDFDNEEEILVPQVDVDSPMTLTEAEGLGEAKKQRDVSFLSKVFVGFKQPKHAEGLDFEEGGNVVARNDEGLIQHEARQVRQRIQWIKERFSKQ